MSYQDFLNKFRQIDNTLAKWVMRHFYFMFFQGVLMIIFLVWFVNIFKVIDVTYQTPSDNLAGQIQIRQLINMTILVLILILNSFWLLFIFNIQQRILGTLKELTFIMNRYTRSGKSSDHHKD